MSQSFAITYDYLCPFARIANETVVQAVRDGADWDVAFRAFSLAQAHVEEGDPDVWDRASDADGMRGVPAHAWSLAVKNAAPDRWLDFHARLFEARHTDAADIDDEAVLREVTEASGVDADAVAARVADGGPMKELAAEHQALVDGWDVFGVPTFIDGDEAVFVRFMERNRLDDLEKVLDMLQWSRLNEFKRTRIPR
jgi:protein-disulfide isomerase-like protein with CxxC motif